MIACKGVIKGISLTRVKGYQKCAKAVFGTPLNTPLTGGKDEFSCRDSKKLLLTLQDKNNYVVHYRNLQFYLNQGMKLKRVHRVLEFDQECWMEPYIMMNTEFRKEAKSDFEKNFYKLMNN